MKLYYGHPRISGATSELIPEPVMVTSCLEAVGRDVARMVVETASMDMVLECREEEIKAHSFILRARSPVFNSMLTLDTKERRDKRVLMEEVEVEVVREMVRYMYTADLDTEFDQLEELLILANRWEAVVATGHGAQVLRAAPGGEGWQPAGGTPHSGHRPAPRGARRGAPGRRPPQLRRQVPPKGSH